MRIRGLIVCVFVVMLPAELAAQGQRARSILFLDQSDLRGPLYYEIFRAFRDRVAADARSHVTIYTESLDLSRFGGATYEQSLREYLREKYRDRPIGVIVTIGAAALELVQRWRTELWPETPVVFGLVDGHDLTRMTLPSDVTGGTVELHLADAIRAARAVVPDLNRIVFVGDDWDRQVVFKSWKEEIPAAAAGLELTQLVGLPMGELQRRLSELPDHSAIVYSAIYSDEEGGYFPPAIVIQPSVIGGDAATRALWIIDGEAISQIPVTLTNVVKLIFNWVDPKAVDVNGIMREAFDLMTSQAAARNVALYLKPALIPCASREIQFNCSRLSLTS
jgi:hypothetical protein